MTCFRYSWSSPVYQPVKKPSQSKADGGRLDSSSCVKNLLRWFQLMVQYTALPNVMRCSLLHVTRAWGRRLHSECMSNYVSVPDMIWRMCLSWWRDTNSIHLRMTNNNHLNRLIRGIYLETPICLQVWCARQNLKNEMQSYFQVPTLKYQ